MSSDPIPAAAENPLPLVYSCSGCSSAAQMTNALAIRLDREGLAEMSCISGVGGHVPALLRTARSNRPILALDGCAMACVMNCLDRAGVNAPLHIVLGAVGVRKGRHVDFDPVQAEQCYVDLVRPAAVALGQGHDRLPRQE